MFTTRQQGDLGEASAIEWLASRGANVFVPVGHSPDYDLVADFGDGPVRVQVKTCTFFRSGRWSVQLETRGGNQSWSGVAKRFGATRCDWLFVLVADGRRWFIPSGEVGGCGVNLGGPKYAAFEVEAGRPMPVATERLSLHSATARRGTEAVKRGGL